MTLNEDFGGGAEAPPFNFVLVPTHKLEVLQEHVRSALARGLPEIRQCTPHEHVLSVAAGGPSLVDTYKDLTGQIAAVNGSLQFLLDKGVVPNLCGVCDPSAHMVDIVEAHPDVNYFVASCVHPSVFEKLLKAGCHVVVWHAGPMDGLTEILDEFHPDEWLQIGGGSTMGLRWINVGYQCGFRSFHLHGVDSSFRMDPTRGKASHAYPDHQDNKEWVRFAGYMTKPNFIAQVGDFVQMIDRYLAPDLETIKLEVHGDGLLPDRWALWKRQHPGKHEG